MKRRPISSRLPKLRAAAFAPLTLLLSMPLAYAAQNLGLTNGTFDVEIHPWEKIGNVLVVPEQGNCGATKCLHLNIEKLPLHTATSEPKLVAPGQFIAASALMKRDAVVGQEDVSLGIVFYDSNDAPIAAATRWSHLTGPVNTWLSVKVSGVAPEGTKSARVVVRGQSAGVVNAYVDNVVMSKIILEDRGHQVFVGRVSAAAIDNESDTLYVAANGNPAKFFTYKVSDGSVQKRHTLPNDEIWSVVVGGDRAAYFGTASGRLYRFDNSKNDAPELIRDFGKTSETSRTNRTIWSLTAGPGNCIYGGLAPAGDESNGFKYCAAAQELTLLTLPTKKDGKAAGFHVRSLAVDPGDNHNASAVYWGMGNPARLYKSALDANGLTDFLTINAAHDYAYYTDFVKDRVFARLTGTTPTRTVVLNRAGTSVSDPVADINSVGISALSPSCSAAVFPSPCQNTVFYTKDLGAGKGTHLSSYRLDANGETALAIQMSPPATFGYAPPSAPTKLVSVLRDPVDGFGKIVRFNLSDLYAANNKAVRETTNFAPPETASGIRTLEVYKGKTYSSGFVNGAIGIGDTEGTNPPVLVKEYLQAEGMAVLGERLYIGGYPGAVIKSFKLTDTGLLEPASPADTTLGSVHGQNRPFAMLAVPKRNNNEADRLVIATVPKKDEQGALAVYSVGELSPWNVLKGRFPGQSILALTRIDDVVYGGTSVWRDIDNPKSDGAAQLFRFSPFGEIAPVDVPITGAVFNGAAWTKKAITALLTVNRQIWILAEDMVLIYDHDKKQFVNTLRTPEQFSYAEWKVSWNAGSMVQSNGYVYFSASDTKLTNVYRVNISKPDSIELVRKGGSGMMKVDAKGNIYFVNEEKVMKYNMALP
ncbi:hypothetical protein HF313_25325 [Massilia atriviolacea]|uniref:Uncharacterized protein n=1 Tax=Massilia atriviolacea TaxID=2495579 RepID=A0A430HN60_9BURK|nr:hypothetical protein [Massilia atriviolacea]RSZ58997.1 hypothetical protein EJB06_11750 [Massilia atriviolacea]